MARRSVGSGAATVNALLKPGKASAKGSASFLKQQKSILKNAITKVKPLKSPKPSAIKPLKLPKQLVKSSMGSFLTKQMSKAKKSFK